MAGQEVRIRRHGAAVILEPIAVDWVWLDALAGAVESIVVHELYFSAFKSQRHDQNLALVDKPRFEVVPFDREDARHARVVRTALTIPGIPIGGHDVLIAGQALARALTLVTCNVRESAQVQGLLVENWADS